MFAQAYPIAASFTRPVVISLVRRDGTCTSGAGSFVVVNDEGWIVTAAHIVKQYNDLTQQKNQFKDYEQKRTEIEKNAGLLSSQKHKKLKELEKSAPADLVTDFSLWWAKDGTKLVDARVMPAADLAVARLEPFEAPSAYPIFKDPSKDVVPGTSLCRLGFPFHEISSSYTPGGFQLAPGTFPMVFFPNEGIMTRVLVPDPKLGTECAFIETSSPGLMGQSGGPIFDKHGTVWGIQSHTQPLPLGFSPRVPGKNTEEHQFLNVGRGAHPATIAKMFKDLGIKHALSAY